MRVLLLESTSTVKQITNNTGTTCIFLLNLLQNFVKFPIYHRQKIYATPKGVYLPKITRVNFAVNCSFSDNLMPLGASFIFCWRCHIRVRKKVIIVRLNIRFNEKNSKFISFELFCLNLSDTTEFLGFPCYILVKTSPIM